MPRSRQPSDSSGAPGAVRKGGATDLPPSVCNNAALRRASRRIAQAYDEAMAPLGLRGTQYSLLNQVDRLDSPTMRPLADALVMDLSALGHTLKPLERDGLLQLMPDADDRRSRRVALTGQGCEVLRRARQQWQKVHERFEAAFGAADAQRLRDTLDWIASPDFHARLAID